MDKNLGLIYRIYSKLLSNENYKLSESQIKIVKDFNKDDTINEIAECPARPNQDEEVKLTSLSFRPIQELARKVYPKYFQETLDKVISVSGEMFGNVKESTCYSAFYAKSREKSRKRKQGSKESTFDEEQIKKRKAIRNIARLTRLFMGEKTNNLIEIRKFSGVGQVHERDRDLRLLNLTDRDTYLTTIGKIVQGSVSVYVRLESKLKSGKVFHNPFGTLTTSDENIVSKRDPFYRQQRPRPICAFSPGNHHLSMFHQSHKAYAHSVIDTPYSTTLNPPLHPEINSQIRVIMHICGKQFKLRNLDVKRQDFEFEYGESIVEADARVFCDLYKVKPHVAEYIINSSKQLFNSKINVTIDNKHHEYLDMAGWPSGLYPTTLSNIIGVTSEVENVLNFEVKNITDFISDAFFKKYGFLIRIFGDNIMVYGYDKQVDEFCDYLIHNYKPYMYNHPKGDFIDNAETYLGGFPVITKSNEVVFLSDPTNIIRFYSPEYDINRKDRGQNLLKPNLAASWEQHRLTSVLLSQYFPFLKKIINLEDKLNISSYFKRNTGENISDNPHKNDKSSKHYFKYQPGIVNVVLKNIDEYLRKNSDY